jgi:hypothetical protein
VYWYCESWFSLAWAFALGANVTAKIMQKTMVDIIHKADKGNFFCVFGLLTGSGGVFCSSIISL